MKNYILTVKKSESCGLADYFTRLVQANTLVEAEQLAMESVFQTEDVMSQDNLEIHDGCEISEETTGVIYGFNLL